MEVIMTEVIIGSYRFMIILDRNFRDGNGWWQVITPIMGLWFNNHMVTLKLLSTKIIIFVNGYNSNVGIIGLSLQITSLSLGYILDEIIYEC